MPRHERSIDALSVHGKQLPGNEHSGRVVRQNFTRDPRRGGSWRSRQTIIGSIQQEDSGGGQPACAWSAHIYIYKGSVENRSGLCRSIVTMVPLRVAPVKGLYPKLRNEFCPQVSPSQVRDAYGPHDGNERARRAIASDGVHSPQQCGPGGLAYSFPPTAPRRHSARDFGMTFAWE